MVSEAPCAGQLSLQLALSQQLGTQAAQPQRLAQRQQGSSMVFCVPSAMRVCSPVADQLRMVAGFHLSWVQPQSEHDSFGPWSLMIPLISKPIRLQTLQEQL